MFARTGNRDGRTVDSSRRRARRVSLAACRISPMSELLLSVLLVAALAGGAVVFLPRGISLPDATLPPAPHTLHGGAATRTLPLIFAADASDPSLSVASGHRGNIGSDMLTDMLGRADDDRDADEEAVATTAGRGDIVRETAQGERAAAVVDGVVTGHAEGPGVAGDGREELEQRMAAIWGGFATHAGGQSVTPSPYNLQT